MKYHSTDLEEPDLVWDSSHAEPGRADRNIAIRNRPDLKPAEERMNIVSNRVIDTDPHSQTTVRLESGLEAGWMAILKAMPGCVAISTQYLVTIEVDGQDHIYYFDFCVDFENGCRILYAVRNAEHAESQEILVELFRNQELENHAHFALVVTEEEISKPAIYRAEQIVLARRKNNQRNNRLVFQTLLQAGGRARVANVLMATPGVAYASAWDALWALIDQGAVVHDHIAPDHTFLQDDSWISVAEATDNETE